VLGFDPEDGLIAFLDDQGQPRRFDLRAAEVRLASRDKLSALASVNGEDIYGVDADGDVVRLNPTGDWKFDPPSPARWVFPQPNGFVIVAGAREGSTLLWLIRPTDDEIIETASLPAVSRGVRTRVGDRLYFTVDSGLIGVTTRDLSPVPSVRLEHPVIAVVPTPSGDRLYVAMRDRNALVVVDRYSDAVAATVNLPGPVSELRMDPLGQRVLARPAGGGDSAWVIAVGADRATGVVRGKWRDDLPAFAHGGNIATARGLDVVFVGAASLADGEVVAGGASDFWYFFSWNGFRPRAAGLDRPVTFDTAQRMPLDSMGVAGRDSFPSPPIRDTAPSMVVPPPTIVPRSRGYMVSFAAVLTQQRANEVAGEISINGVRPRVIPSQTGATTIYRVVLGPYPAREEAERVGRDSKRQYWVYEAPQ
jgi:hypothetical protein